MDEAEENPMPTTRPVTLNGVTMSETMRAKKAEYHRWRAELEEEAEAEVRAAQAKTKSESPRKKKDRSASPSGSPNSPFTKVSSEDVAKGQIYPSLW